jgi:hypothetical protein
MKLPNGTIGSLSPVVRDEYYEAKKEKGLIQGDYPFYINAPWDTRESQPFDFGEDFDGGEDEQYAVWAKQLGEGTK